MNEKQKTVQATDPGSKDVVVRGPETAMRSLMRQL